MLTYNIQFKARPREPSLLPKKTLCLKLQQVFLSKTRRSASGETFSLWNRSLAISCVRTNFGVCRPLTKAYDAAVKSVFLPVAQQQSDPGNSGDRGKAAADAAEEKQNRLKMKSRKQLEEELNVLWCNARLFAESCKLFQGEHAQSSSNIFCQSMAFDPVYFQHVQRSIGLRGFQLSPRT